MLEDLVVEKELIFGHTARRLLKFTESKTHNWEIFIYSPIGEDLTRWIDHVIIHLHSSFEKPIRYCMSEPYKVSEDGWGEFDSQIEIRLRCSGTIMLDHAIKFPISNSKKPSIMNKKKIKIVFRNPPPLLYEGLSSAPFSWNKIKREKKNIPLPDTEVIDLDPTDKSIEIKWLAQVREVSQQIRKEISILSENQKIQRARILSLIDSISSNNPDVSEVANLLL